MPPTRRFPTKQSVSVKLKITRRKLRKSTWLDLLAHHNRGSSFHYDQQSHACSPSQYSHTSTPTGQFLKPSKNVSKKSDLLESQPDNPFLLHAEIRESRPIRAPTDIEVNLDQSTVPPRNTLTEHFFDTECISKNHDITDTTDDSDDSTMYDTTTEDDGDFRYRQFAITSGNIMALTLLCGSIRFSVKQYDIVRSGVKFAGQETELPSYSTVQRKFFPRLLNNCFPSSFVKTFTSDPEGEQRTDSEESGKTNRVEVLPFCSRIVYPTEWAKCDVACLPYFENIYGNSTMKREEQGLFSVESLPIVRYRDPFVNATRYLFADDMYGRRPVGPGEIVSFNVLKIPFGTSEQELKRNNFEIFQATKGVHISSTIVASWCVSSPSGFTESAEAAFDRANGALKEVILEFSRGCTFDGESWAASSLREKRIGQRFFADKHDLDGSVVPGDVFTLLSTSHCQSESVTDICCIIVSRYWKKFEGATSQFVLWIRTIPENTAGGLFQPFAIQRIHEVPKCVVSKNQPNSLRPIKRNARLIGTLKDGRRYVIYHVLLYCDDFTESGSPYSQASCGGVYLLPIGLSPSARRSRAAVQVVSLTPSVVSTNEVLLEIVPDIIKGSTGVEGKLSSGQPVMIFLDVVGFVADYPAAAAPSDVLGHTGDAPCTHCRIGKYKNESSSSMGFTTNLHACNSTSLRCAERHDALRESNIPNRDANILGMKSNEYTAKNDSPLSTLRTQRLLCKKKHSAHFQRNPCSQRPVRSLSFQYSCTGPFTLWASGMSWTFVFVWFVQTSGRT